MTMKTFNINYSICIFDLWLLKLLHSVVKLNSVRILE